MFHDAHQRTVAIGVWITAYSLGGAIGPLLGGVLLEFFWWGSVFLLAVPVMALLLVLGPILLPEFRDPDAGRLDLAQRGALARRRARGRLRAQADRAGRARVGRRSLSMLVGRRARRRVRAPADEARRPADRPAALPRARLQRVARRLHARHPRALRGVPLHLPVPAARGRAVAAPCGPVDAALVRRVHRRLDAGPGDRAPGASRVRHGGWAGDRAPPASRC